MNSLLHTPAPAAFCLPCPGAKHGRARPVRAAVVVRSQARPVPNWTVVYQELTGRKLETISPEVAKARADKGDWVIVDVRTPDQFEAGHAAGAASVPMYRKIKLQGATPMKLLKIVLFQSNGVTPVEPNDLFLEQLEAATEGGAKGAVFLCEAGGTMKPSVNFQLGKSSRSLQAAYLALQAGKAADKVAHLERGLYGWYQSDLPINGAYTPDIGRTPSAAADPTLKNVSAAVGYETRPEDRQPEAKKGWWGF